MDPKFLQYLKDNETSVRYLVDNIDIIRQLIDHPPQTPESSKQYQRSQTSPKQCHKCHDSVYDEVECRDCFRPFNVCETHYNNAYNYESPSKSKGHYCNHCD